MGMKAINVLLTHPGGAHKDEFLACCVLLAVHPVRIERREPQPADLGNPETCVVDVGHLHEPERNNFDHHQFPKDHVPTCSLSLVLDHLNLYQDTRQFCEWLEPTEWFDCRGPHETARWLGVGRDVLNQLNSPIDGTLLRAFAGLDRLMPGEALWEIMRMIGQDIVGYVRSLRARLDWIAEQAEIWTLDKAGSPVNVLFLPRTEPIPDEPSMGLDRYVESCGLEGQMIGLVYPDRRGEGYALSRFRDKPQLNFSRIAQDSRVHFAHVRGFVAKTSATAEAQLKDLLTLSLVP
jgi:hypothetical protein